MTNLQLFGHPFSSYHQKALIGLYENAVPFRLRMLSPDELANGAEWAALWPMKRFPVLVDGGRTFAEATIILEYLDVHYRGNVPLIPDDPDAALDTRMMDRFFDNYISTPQQKIVFDALRPDDAKDPAGVADAHAQLETAYAWLDGVMADRQWATGDVFTLADCGAAPFLFYAHWVHPIAARFANVLAYRIRLLERPSFARAVDEARPYRAFFPLPVPDED